jgi:hypothetical protein
MGVGSGWQGHARPARSVPVALWLVQPLDMHAQVLGLLLGQRRRVHARRVEVQPRQLCLATSGWMRRFRVSWPMLTWSFRQQPPCSPMSELKPHRLRTEPMPGVSVPYRATTKLWAASEAAGRGVGGRRREGNPKRRRHQLGRRTVPAASTCRWCGTKSGCARSGWPCQIYRAAAVHLSTCGRHSLRQRAKTWA